jgi:hypothetical protein
MSRARGQRSGILIDREYPHQVMVLALTVSGRVIDEVVTFHQKMGVPTITRSMRKDDEWHTLYCFGDANHAKLFRATFGGEVVLR